MSLEKSMADLQAAVEVLTSAVLSTAKLAPAVSGTPADASKKSPLVEQAAQAQAAGDAAINKARAAKPAAKKDDGMSAEALTEAITQAVAATSGAQVKAVLTEFGVAKGRDVTDGAERAKLAAKLTALVASVGDDDIT